MAVLAVPLGKPFEVDTDKVELFEKVSKEHKSKEILLERLKKHDKGDVSWKLEK